MIPSYFGLVFPAEYYTLKSCTMQELFTMLSQSVMCKLEGIWWSNGDPRACIMWILFNNMNYFPCCYGGIWIPGEWASSCPMVGQWTEGFLCIFDLPHFPTAKAIVPLGMLLIFNEEKLTPISDYSKLALNANSMCKGQYWRVKDRHCCPGWRSQVPVVHSHCHSVRAEPKNLLVYREWLVMIPFCMIEACVGTAALDFVWLLLEMR